MRIENHSADNFLYPVKKYVFDKILWGGTPVGRKRFKGAPGPFEDNTFHHVRDIIKPYMFWWTTPNPQEQKALREQYPKEVLVF